MKEAARSKQRKKKSRSENKQEAQKRISIQEARKYFRRRNHQVTPINLPTFLKEI